MKCKFESVSIESAKGNVSTKDATKYYGSAILKYRDPDTRKKESFEITVNDPVLIQVLEKYETDEKIVDVTVNVSHDRFGYKFQDVVSVDIRED